MTKRRLMRQGVWRVLIEHPYNEFAIYINNARRLGEVIGANAGPLVHFRTLRAIALKPFGMMRGRVYLK